MTFTNIATRRNALSKHRTRLEQPRQKIQEDSAMTIDTINGKKATTQSTSSQFVPTILTTPGSAALRITNSELPAAIQVDETTNREVARRLGAGVQVYDCNPNSSTFKFREPQANLYDLKTLTQRGIHFATETPSPNWADADGSRVVCKLTMAIDALRRPIPPRTSAG